MQTNHYLPEPRLYESRAIDKLLPFPPISLE